MNPAACMNPAAAGCARWSKRNMSSLQRNVPALSESCAGTPTDSHAASIARSGNVAKCAFGASSITDASHNCTPALSAIRASRKLTATRSNCTRSAFALSPSATTASGRMLSKMGSSVAHALPALSPVTTGSVTYAREPCAHGRSARSRAISIVGLTGLPPNGSKLVTKISGRGVVIRRCPRPKDRASRAACVP